jgi:hypothetical protein
MHLISVPTSKPNWAIKWKKLDFTIQMGDYLKKAFMSNVIVPKKCTSFQT